jgi:hypothetical protein
MEILKIVTFSGTQLSNKTATLSDVNENGFLFVDDNDEEELLDIETIKEYFVGKKVKIKIEEVSRNVVE